MLRLAMVTGWSSSYAKTMDTGPAFHVKFWDIVISINQLVQARAFKAPGLIVFIDRLCEQCRVQSTEKHRRKRFLGLSLLAALSA